MWTRKWVLTRHRTCQHLHLGLLSLLVVRNSFLPCIRPRLLYDQLPRPWHLKEIGQNQVSSSVAPCLEYGPVLWFALRRDSTASQVHCFNPGRSLSGSRATTRWACRCAFRSSHLCSGLPGAHFCPLPSQPFFSSQPFSRPLLSFLRLS